MSKEVKSKHNRKKQILASMVPLMWDSYESILTIRQTNIQNRVNFLLVIATFLPTICVGLYAVNQKGILLIPIAFLFWAIVVLLRSFLIIPPSVPWFDMTKSLSQVDSGTYELEILSGIKVAENGTYPYMIEMKKIINFATYLISFSLFATLLSFVFAFFNLWLCVYFIILIIFGLASYCGRKSLFKEETVFDEQENYKGQRKNIYDWLNK